MSTIYLDAVLLLEKVEELKGHWVGKYLVNVYISCYRGTKKQIDLKLFSILDEGNKKLFIGILNMRKDWLYSDEDLYEIEQQLKKIVGVK